MSGYLWLAWAASAVVVLGIWLIVIPLGLRGIFDALGADRSRAWIPFVNLATVYRLGGLSEYWLIALVIPGADVLGMVMLFVASHRITRRLGHSGWFTLLAVVMWWAWALAIGLQHDGSWPKSAEPVVWSVQRRPQATLRLSGDDATPSPSDASDPLPADASVTASPAIEPLLGDALLVERQRAAPVGTAPVVADLAALVQERHEALRVAAAEVSEVAAPVPPAPPAAERVVQASVAPPQAEADDDATILTSGARDQTVISARRRPHWWVHTTMGARVELTGTAAILGRRPQGHPLYPDAQLITVTDDAVSVSATHAVLEYVDGDWQVTDLGSTNGVWLVDPMTGNETELGMHRRARVTPRFMLGELGVEVVRNA